MSLIELRRLINEKKQELYRSYWEQGISSNVLKLSTDLDKLIYQYQILSAPWCCKKDQP
ncbi:MAG: aspartyl-phosphate phosphatase Spo0E family protein [Firmicutes bacterium]|nr:aspartyl-phosphate phosphatase Spo0E family protein [Bacillota bacterium]